MVVVVKLPIVLVEPYWTCLKVLRSTRKLGSAPSSDKKLVWIQCPHETGEVLASSVGLVPRIISFQFPTG